MRIHLLRKRDPCCSACCKVCAAFVTVLSVEFYKDFLQFTMLTAFAILQFIASLAHKSPLIQSSCPNNAVLEM